MNISIKIQQKRRSILHTSIPGNGVTSEPTAMRIFLVLRISFEPSSFFTLTSPGPFILP